MPPRPSPRAPVLASAPPAAVQPTKALVSKADELHQLRAVPLSGLSNVSPPQGLTSGTTHPSARQSALCSNISSAVCVYLRESTGWPSSVDSNDAVPRIEVRASGFDLDTISPYFPFPQSAFQRSSSHHLLVMALGPRREPTSTRAPAPHTIRRWHRTFF